MPECAERRTEQHGRARRGVAQGRGAATSTSLTHHWPVIVPIIVPFKTMSLPPENWVSRAFTGLTPPSTPCRATCVTVRCGVYTVCTCMLTVLTGACNLVRFDRVCFLRFFGVCVRDSALQVPRPQVRQLNSAQIYLDHLPSCIPQPTQTGVPCAENTKNTREDNRRRRCHAHVKCDAGCTLTAR